MSDLTPTPVDAVVARVKKVYRSWGRATTVEQMRSDWDTLFGVDEVAAVLEPVVAGGVPGQWVTAPGARPDQVLLYFHGGGFQVGSSHSHLELMAWLSASAGCRVLGLDYRRAPEHHYPAPLEDACTAYAWLQAQGFAPTRIAFGGDSAGGGLALSTLLAERAAGRALPAAVVLMSAWTDLTAAGASYETRAGADPIHQRAMILAMARGYLGEQGDPRDPLASPLWAELHGLPPMLIQVGDRETVLSDSTEFADKARAAGTPVVLEVWPHMVHVFQQFPRELVEAREALQSIGTFLKSHLPSQDGASSPTPRGL